MSKYFETRKMIGVSRLSMAQLDQSNIFGEFNLYFGVKRILIRHHEIKQDILRLKKTIFTNFITLNISTKKELGSMKVYELLILLNSKMGSWINNKHYYKSKVQFTSQYHYRTFKSEITSLHFIDFTLVKVISL
jgi:hypothetical protein